DRSSIEVRRGLEALAAEVDALETAESGGMAFFLLGLAQEKGLLQALAWVVEEPSVAPQDLVAARRLLPHRSFPTLVRTMYASEAGSLLAHRPSALSDADMAQVLDGYRELPMTVEQARSALAAGSRASRATSPPKTLPAALVAAVRPNFASTVEQIATI